MMKTAILSDPEPRAYTEEEARSLLLDHFHALVNFWSSPRVVGERTTKECLEGLVHSILVTFDGCAAGLPAFDVSCSPHPDDKDYRKENRQNWFEPGQVINDCQLHELWYKTESKTSG